MNDEDIELIIEITYNDKKFSIEDINLNDLNQLIKQSISHFNIENKFQKRIVFTYKDEDGDINIISNKDDIIKSSKGIGSKKYLSKLELNIVSDEKNKKNEETTYDEHQEIKNLEENEEIKKLEEMNNLKDNKINELEDKIIKLKKECQKLKDNSNNNIPIKNVLIEESELKKNNNNNQNNQIINESVKNELKNIISDMFKTERENLENNFKKLKIDLISEINNNMKKDKQYKDELNKIFDDISFIKENIEINMKENKDEQNKMNNYYNQFLNNNMERIKPTKFYKCQNCNCGFMFNECFDIANNKAFDEHNFILEKLEGDNKEKNLIINKNEIINNNNKGDINEIEENIKEEKEKEKIKINDDNNDINKNNIKNKKEVEKVVEKEKNKKKEMEKKEEKMEEKKKEEKKKEVEINDNNNENVEENEAEDDYQEVFKFQSILQNYFFNENGKLKDFSPNENELEEIKNYYKSVKDKINIKSYQEAYIEKVNKEVLNIKNKSLISKIIGNNGRIQSIQNLYSNYVLEKKYGKYNKKRFHNKKYQYH